MAGPRAASVAATAAPIPPAAPVTNATPSLNRDLRESLVDVDTAASVEILRNKVDHQARHKDRDVVQNPLPVIGAVGMLQAGKGIAQEDDLGRHAGNQRNP